MLHDTPVKMITYFHLRIHVPTPLPPILQSWRNILRAPVQIVYKFRRNTLACPLDFEELSKVLEPSIVIINYCALIINAYYNYNCIINAQCNYYVSNKGLLEECDKEENVAVTGAAVTSCLKEDSKTFRPMSRIRQVTARPTS